MSVPRKMDSYLAACYFISLFSMVFFTSNYAQPQAPVLKPKPSALFVFGDSTVDAGNNNFIETPMKSNFPPYGRDFVNHIPTGRFTNGRLVTDFIASYAGVKDIVPAYLDPTLGIKDLMTGVTFASAGSGFDPMTATLSSTISFDQQMEYFKEYKSKIEMHIGKESTVDLIARAVFVISAGTNDFVVNYYGLGGAVNQYIYPNVTSYSNFLLQNIDHVIKEMVNQGARKIVMVGLPPMGCLPEVITLNRDSGDRKCVGYMLSAATNYNLILENKLKAMQTVETKFYYVDIYKPVLNMIEFGESKFGFEKVSTGCCGSGYIEAGLLCNMNSPVCDDASKYVFWDSVHPTERTYHYVFTTLRPVIDTVLNDYINSMIHH